MKVARLEKYEARSESLKAILEADECAAFDRGIVGKLVEALIDEVLETDNLLKIATISADMP
jgi:hypothetical protein